MGLVYVAVAIVAGGWFLYESHHLYGRAIRHGDIKPMRVFHSSITYLTLIFVAVGVDPLVHIPLPF
jgi:protoheme IX farnesyltransferase